MALKKISKETNELLIAEASRQSILNQKKIWPDELVEKYILEGIERDNQQRFIENSQNKIE